ncbi:MAG: HlyD family efflux transporter periplasmic adaptor subunit [Sedimentisphaerales bacterium]|nr:HlyD family efflux transporter periplasmic adaptor subunit [Sedimentisphaerales bacterium]
MAEMNAQLSAFQERLSQLERAVVELCVSDTSREDLFRIFLEQTVSVLGVGGAIWVGEGDSWEMVCHMNLSPAGLEENGRQRQLADMAVGRVVQTGSAVILPGNGGANVYDGGLGDSVQNDCPNTLLFVPIVEGKKVAAVLALISPEEVDPRAVRGYGGFVVGLCARVGIFLQRKRIEDLHEEMTRSDRLRDYVSSLHSSLDPQRVCYALANYGQELLGVYRCMVGTYNAKGKFRVESVSGLESVAVKSSFVKSISEIARVVCENNKTLLVDNPEAVNSAEVSEGGDLITAARLYMLQAESKSLGVFPIRYEDNVVGAMIVEKATEEAITDSERLQCEGLLTDAGVALYNSMSYSTLPFAFLMRPLGRLRDRVWRMGRARRIFWAAVVLALVLIPILVPMEIKIVGTAEVVAVSARMAYAQQDGVIREVSVPEDHIVAAGDVLASLDDRAMQSSIDRVTHQWEEARLLRNQARQSGNAAMADRYQLSMNALEAEQAILEHQMSQFQIIAPVSGRVVSSESTIAHLLSRPVTRGEAILEIVPDDTEWEFLVSVPENDAGDLLRAYDDPERVEPLRAWVILNAHPDRKYASEVISVAPRAQVIATGEREYRNVISVRVSVPEELRKMGLRQGMEGKVAVECGGGNLLYAVTHEFVDFVRRSTF